MLLLCCIEFWDIILCVKLTFLAEGATNGSHGAIKGQKANNISDMHTDTVSSIVILVTFWPLIQSHHQVHKPTDAAVLRPCVN